MSVRLERMLAFDAQIRSGAHPSVLSLMQRFEVSERTVRLDLAFLRERFGAPLHYDRARGGYRYTEPGWKLPNLLMSEGELMAFFLSVELAQRYLGTAFEETLRKAVGRLAAEMPSELWVDLQQLAEHYTFQAGATAGADPALLTALARCVIERWPVEMLYFTASTGERRRRVIDPYHLFNVQGDWQIIAYDHWRQAVRQFAVSRVEEWQVLRSERFERDPGFSPSTYLSTGFLAERGDTTEAIEIWFDAYQAAYIRGRQWHPTQTVEEHADGSLTLRFTSGAMAEIRRWAMSLGRHAVINRPPSLVADLLAECRATLRAYGAEERPD